MANPQQRLQELHQILRQHSYRYHVLNAPAVSDHEYDQLYNELKQIETEHPDWVTPDSPTQRTGASPSEKFSKVQHPAPILSLANAFDGDDLLSWLERISKLDERAGAADFVVEPKLDGLTVILHYRDGLFVQGATRGNGEVGEDVTANLKTLGSIPLRLPVMTDGPKPPSYLVVRGEVFIPLAAFAQLNQRQLELGEKTYQTPRNTAAGALRQLDPVITAARPLTILCYSIITADGALPKTQFETIEYLRALGFPTPDNITKHDQIESVVATCEAWIEKRQDLAYEIDGAVVKINDHALAADLGIVGKDPRGAIAFKFPAQEVTTQLNDIGVNVGRTGVLTPYAILETIEIGGVNVSQATLHNFDFIAEKNIRIGDRVRVKRAGDVIPYIIGPIKLVFRDSELPYLPPKTCPACGEPVQKIAGEVALYCLNPVCPAQLVRNIEHYVSRATLDIVGLGIKIVEQLVDAGLLHSISDLYSLDGEQLLELEGFKTKRVDNLLASIEASKSKPLEKFLFALGIRGVGEVVASDLAKRFGSLSDLSLASAESLEAIEGIGPNIAKALITWFSRPTNQKIMQELQSVGMWPTATIIDDQGSEYLVFHGMTFVITGTLPSFSRNEAKVIIQENGGKVTSSVSQKTSYLLAGDKAGSKLSKAEELAVPILDEAKFLEMIAQAQPSSDS